MKFSWNNNFTYYFSIFMPITVSALIFYFLFMDSQYEIIDSTSEFIIFLLKFFWLSGVIVALSNIIGLLWFGNPEIQNMMAEKKFNKNKWRKDDFLIAVFVSRGDNAKALQRSVKITESILRRNKVNHRIDVVTDMPVQHTVKNPNGNTIFHLVPEGYTTINGAKWKARALHYVVEQHGVDNHFIENKHLNTWVLHLDEESQLTKSSLAGISEFISNSENKNIVGQGEIKYNAHNYGENIFITWADCIRSGDDLGRFRFQFGLFKKPLFGMHGSYILAPLHIEQKYGFDLGGRGSVTEDAYFALKCSEEGILFKWVNGYIREQSPFSIMALAKQRRRWFSGLMMLSFDKEIKLSTRLPLMINTLLWGIAWIGPLATILALIFGGYFPLPLLLIASLLQGFYASTYMVGAMRNIINTSEELSIFKKILIYFGSLIGVHIASLLEGFSILYAIIKPVKTFEVVNKN